MAKDLRSMPAPRVLLKQVYDSAPWMKQAPAPDLGQTFSRPLAACSKGEHGWWAVLQAAKGWQRLQAGNGDELVDYFTLCCACHHASVATYVPTDVDSKIRSHLWRLASSDGLVRRLITIALRMNTWDRDGCSRRHLDSDFGPISGHDGEYLSVWIAGLAAAHKRQLSEEVDLVLQRIEEECERQAQCWQHETDPQRKCILAAILTHNAGDIDQGLGYVNDKSAKRTWSECWGNLARSGHERFGGAFAEAAALYRQGMSAEGHRHYPLRPMHFLRRDKELLLPFSPFLRDWGKTVVTHAALDHDDRLAFISGLIAGCDTTPNQRGYPQALAGAIPHAADLIPYLPPAQQNALRAGALHDDINISAEATLAALQ